MTSQSQAREIANGMVGLTAIEKRIAQNRLAKFYDGDMPMWNRQCEKTGPASIGYLLVAYVWGAFAGIFAVFGCPFVFIQHKSGGLMTIEISLFSISALLLIFGRVRQIQGRRVGRKYHNPHLR